MDTCKQVCMHECMLWLSHSIRDWLLACLLGSFLLYEFTHSRNITVCHTFLGRNRKPCSFCWQYRHTWVALSCWLSCTCVSCYQRIRRSSLFLQVHYLLLQIAGQPSRSSGLAEFLLIRFLEIRKSEHTVGSFRVDVLPKTEWVEDSTGDSILRWLMIRFIHSSNCSRL